eukprot:TRINITY_DN2001_c0_g1_i1.p2 TRINITY_DN2001_c0_g1~~TRINITY_DN2001_c0_g1_i1.p2  ORF type:complete len:51 (-),score=12.64 TRINITY_DN2001_c0_g1_i1:53-205(-)
MYCWCKTHDNVHILLELVFQRGQPDFRLCIKTEQPAYVPSIQRLIETVIA